MAIANLKKKFCLYLLLSSIIFLLVGAKDVTSSVNERQEIAKKVKICAEHWGKQMISEVPIKKRYSFNKALNITPEIIYYTARRIN